VWVKVGMTLFYRYGPAIVDEMRARGLRVFLDLKLHDIPFQIRGAAFSASLTGADILSIHGLGGAAMISEGRAGVEEAAELRGGERTRLVAISVLTSMDSDGTKNGYDLELTRAISDAVGIPVIASGGAGTLEHFREALTEGGADAALAASLFHFKELEIRQVKEYLHSKGIPVRL
jgi:orotidine-5'-phosphate decarboxylase